MIPIRKPTFKPSQPIPSLANRKSPPTFSARFRGVNEDDGQSKIMRRQMLGEGG